MEGREVLIRKLYIAEKDENKYLEMISMGNSEKIGYSITFKREIYRIDPHFRNYICENFTISSSELFTDFKYLDYELILKLKQNSEIKYPAIKSFINKSNPECTHKIVKFKHSKKIIKINICKPARVTEFSINPLETHQF